jgi:hypothetical protein
MQALAGAARPPANSGFGGLLTPLHELFCRVAWNPPPLALLRRFERAQSQASINPVKSAASLSRAPDGGNVVAPCLRWFGYSFLSHVSPPQKKLPGQIEHSKALFDPALACRIIFVIIIMTISSSMGPGQGAVKQNPKQECENPAENRTNHIG